MRYARAYGSRLHGIVGNARGLADLGQAFGADLYAAEVEYLVRDEWAHELDDILWRRSKLGLRLDAAQRERLGAWLQTRR